MALPVTSTAHQIAAKALTWLHTRQEQHALPTHPCFEHDRSKIKRLGETAFAASLVLREAVAGSHGLRLARDLLDYAWHQLGAGTVLHAHLLSHPLADDVVQIYAPFARSGYRHPPLDQLLAHTTSLRSVRAADIPPDQRLGYANAAEVCGFSPGGTDAEATAGTTWLSAEPEPWLIDYQAAYAMTHTVFHHTDWGGLPSRLPAGIAQYLTRWLPVWAEVWGEIGSWDLVAELAMTGSCLPTPLCSEPLWQRLAQLQHQDGLLPRNAQPVSDDPEERFLQGHHPTVVAVAAGTLTVSRTLSVPR
ncbi:DUF6895 family protein [Streptomyces albidochromogenes]|uniref:DUF6895 family protein n=1 Tax=Streptomyces albidochromogenes TaxID=329524 RepID=A0ABW6FHV5_9ACTN